MLLLAAIAPAAQAGWGSSTLLETGSGAAGSQQIVTDSSGNSLAVWGQDDGSGTWKIYANRYSEASNTWGTATVISGSQSVGTTSLGVDGSGNAIVVWHNGTSVYANRFNASTGLWGTPATINSMVANGNVQVAVAANGKAVAVWTAVATDPNQRLIYANVFNGASWGTATLRASIESKDYPPSIAVDASGNALLVFVRNDAEYGNLLKYSYFTASNSTWSAITDPVSPSDKVFGHAPQVVFAGTDAVLVWRDSTTADSRPAYIKANIFNGTTKTWGSTASTLHSVTDNDQIYNFRMAARDTGDVLVAIVHDYWYTSRTDTHIRCTLFSAGSWQDLGNTSVVSVSPNTADFMPAIDAAGKAVVLYRLSGSGDTTIKSVRNTGTSWYDALTVGTGSNLRFATQTNFNPRAAWVSDSDIRSAVYDELVPAAPIIIAPASGATVASPATVSGTAEKNSTVKVSSTGGYLWGTATTDASGNWSMSVAFTSGSKNIEATATDSVGNVSAKSTAVSFTVASVPAAPTITGITPGNGQLSAAFTAGSDGGSSITNYEYSTNSGSTYTVRSPASTTSPIVITGLTNGTTYSVKIRAVNAIGAGTASATVTGTPGAVPGAPTGVSAAAGNAQAAVSFTPPTSNGGSAITGYTVTSTPGSITATGAASPITITGLTNGTAYTFKVKATNAMGTGTESAASNSVTPATVPGAPAIGTATAGNSQAAVSFTSPTSNGGSAITGYTVTSTPGNITATGTASPITITGLTNGAAYTFKVKATNAMGTGAESASSNSATPATVPGAPTIGTATAGNAQATVTFTAPADNGGSSITGYTVTSSPGKITGTGAASPITVTGLTNGTAYTFTVKAANAAGTGAASASSNSVTPSAGTFTVTPTAGTGGTISPNTPQTVTSGETTVFTVSANTGYLVDAVTGCGGTLDRSTYTTSPITADCAVTASFSIRTYTVTFNSNGGSSVGSVLAAYGSTISAPTAPTRTGYAFGGWYKESGLLNAWNFGSDTVTANITLYAKWNVLQHTVSFNSNGGSSVGSVLVDYGSTISAPTAPARTGYTFGGWHKEAGLLNAWNFGSDTVTADMTLHAKWNAATYTVTFDLAGGTRTGGGELVQTIGHGQAAAEPVFDPPPDKTFSGWSASFSNITADATVTALYGENIYTVTFDLAGGTRTGGGALVQTIAHGQGATAPVFTPPVGKTFTGWSTTFNNITVDTTVTAQYADTTYTVTFDLAGGTRTGGGALVQTIVHGQGATAPVFTPPTGQTFTGWSAAVYISAVFDSVTADVTATAQYALNQYTVTFNSNGGSAVDSVNVDHGNIVTAPTDPARTGHVFDGWYREEGLTNPWVFASDTVTASSTLYAKWTINTYTVSLSAADGGSVVPNTPQTVNYNETQSFSLTPFAGYSLESAAGCGGSLDGTTYTTGPVTANCTVTIVFASNSYTVTFDSTGGSSVGSITAEHGDTIAAPIDPARTGHIFGGWHKEEGLLNAWDFGSDTVTADTTLFAKWNSITYAVTFNSTGGSAVNEVIAEHGSTIAAPEAPTMTGYTFAGWHKDAGLTNAWNFGSDTVTANVILFAKWTVDAYVVTFEANGGSASDSVMAEHGTTISAPADPTRTGYTFAGWYKETGLSNLWVFASDTVTADTTLYAKWTTVTANTAPTVPALSAPTDGDEVTTQTPELAVIASTDAEGDPVSYVFELDTVSSFDSGNKQASGEIGSTNWTPSTLTDNTSYWWRARATDGAASSGWMSTASFFVNTVNDAPTAPGISSPANNSQASSLTPALTVTNASDIDNDTLTYEFEVYANSNYTGLATSFSGIVQGGSGETSWTVDTGLSDFTTYYWRARARDEHNLAGDWASAAFIVNTVNMAPTAPTLGSPESGGETTSATPVLSVNNATDDNGDSLSYLFEIDTVNTFNSENKQTSGLTAEGSGTTSWTPAALTDNTTWHWRAKANDGLTDGTWMVTASFFVNTENDAPRIPTILNPAGGSDVTVLNPTLSVNAAVDIDNDILTYDFRVYSDSGLTDLVSSVTEQGTSSVVSPDLSDNTMYWWTARAVDEHGLAGGWMTASSFFVNNNGVNDAPTITLTTPSASESVVTGDSFTITWADSDPDSDAIIILGYDTTGSGCSGTVITTGISEDSSVNSHIWDITALPVGTYYVYAVIDDGATSACSYAAGPLTRSDLKGDLNNDGLVNVNDALKALRIAAGIDAETTADLQRGDVAPLVNGTPQPDGRIDIGDVVVILRKAVGLVAW